MSFMGLSGRRTFTQPDRRAMVDYNRVVEVDILDHGAAADGVTNDTEAIRSAVAKAASVTRGNPLFHADVRFWDNVYACCPDDVEDSVIDYNGARNIRLLGEDAEVKFFAPGMTSPLIGWMVTDDAYFKTRIGGFVRGGSWHEGLGWEGIFFNGQRPATDNAAVGGSFREVVALGSKLYAINDQEGSGLISDASIDPVTDRILNFTIYDDIDGGDHVPVAVFFQRATPSDTLPSPFVEGEIYWYHTDGDHSYLAVEDGGDPIDITTTGSGNFYLRRSQTFDWANRNLGWGQDKLVKFGQTWHTLPAELVMNNHYYVWNDSASGDRWIQISTSVGGAQLTLTDLPTVFRIFNGDGWIMGNGAISLGTQYRDCYALKCRFENWSAEHIHGGGSPEGTLFLEDDWFEGSVASTVSVPSLWARRVMFKDGYNGNENMQDRDEHIQDFEDCDFEDLGYGVVAWGRKENYLRVVNSRFKRVRGSCIFSADGGRNIDIKQNEFRDCDRLIQLQTGFQAEGWGGGDGWGEVYIEDNDIIQETVSASQIIYSQAPVTNLQIRRNRFINLQPGQPNAGTILSYLVNGTFHTGFEFTDNEVDTGFRWPDLEDGIKSDWATGKAYNGKSYVRHPVTGALLRCIVNHTSEDPFEPSYWTLAEQRRPFWQNNDPMPAPPNGFHSTTNLFGVPSGIVRFLPDYQIHRFSLDADAHVEYEIAYSNLAQHYPIGHTFQFITQNTPLASSSVRSKRLPVNAYWNTFTEDQYVWNETPLNTFVTRDGRMQLAGVPDTTVPDLTNAMRHGQYYLPKVYSTQQYKAGLTADVFKPTDLPLYDTNLVNSDPVIIVWFHGGGWTSRNQVPWHTQAMMLSFYGYTVVVPQYTLHNAAAGKDITDCVADAMDAYQWVLANRVGLCGDASARVVVAGESAGGHLAAMIACTAETRPHGSIIVNGVLDLQPLSWQTVLETTGGDSGVAASLSPVTLVDADVPKSLILHGTADGVVPQSQAIAYAAALSGESVPVTTYYPAKNHGFYIWDPDNGFNDNDEIFASTQQILSWLGAQNLEPTTPWS